MYGTTVNVNVRTPMFPAASCAWSVKLDVGSAAEYEVGLRFVDLTQDDRVRLKPLLPPSPLDSHHPDGYVRDT